MSTLEDILGTSEDVQYIGEYHDSYLGGGEGGIHE